MRRMPLATTRLRAKSFTSTAELTASSCECLEVSTVALRLPFRPSSRLRPVMPRSRAAPRNECLSQLTA